MPRTFLIKVNAKDAPKERGQPELKDEWENGAFKTGYPATRKKDQDLPVEQTEPPQPGDKLYIWINEKGLGGRGLTATAEVDRFDGKSKPALLYVRGIRLLPPGCLEEDQLKNLGKDRGTDWHLHGNIFDYIARSRGVQLRYLSDQDARDIDTAIEQDLDTSKWDQDARDEVERRKRLARRAERPEQVKFSRTIRRNYNGRCAVTGCTTGPALHAAHIRVAEDVDDNSENNGILLRADIHALFDALLITLTEEGTGIEMSRNLTDPKYVFLRWVAVRSPSHGNRPSLRNIKDHRNRFKEEERKRR